MFGGTANIMWNIPHVKLDMGNIPQILSIPRNTAMDLNNVM